MNKLASLFPTQRRFPAYVALAALSLFLATLSWSLTPQNLPLAAKVAGWDWQPMSSPPLLWLLTLPLRFLPAAWVPAALSVFAALCGALTLGLLARSVNLLPWERPWSVGQRWGGKLPVVFACAACGLQHSFWQAATTASGETLDLLLLATAIWCVLEFNAGKNLRWLDAAALAWGLGLAQNWAMVLGLPLFVGALIWVRRVEFFNARFLARMALLGLAGFSVYALLPVANGLSPWSPWGFGEAWRMTLRTTGHTFAELYRRLWAEHRLALVVVSGYFLLPTLPCLLRRGGTGTAYVPPAERFEVWLYRLARAVFLGGCLWLALNPTLGPRPLLRRETGLAIPLLTFDYLNGLGIGFLAGSLLLLFQPAASQQRSSADFPWQRRPWARRAAFAVLGVLCGGLTLWLMVCNTPALLAANHDSLEGFGTLAERSLPNEKGIILSDDPTRLTVLQAALDRRGRAGQWLAVDTGELPSPEYRGLLERRHPAGWLTSASRHKLSSPETLELLDRLVRNESVYYLHSSFGFFFERFQLQAHGAIYALVRRNPDASARVSATNLTETKKTQEEIWRREMEPLEWVKAAGQPGISKLEALVCARLHLSPVPTGHGAVLKQWYSAVLDAWGVELQRQGSWPQARERFELALALNANNYSARVNLRCNTNLAAGHRVNLLEMGQSAANFTDKRALTLALRQCGPFDDPVLCLALGRVFQRTGLVRQANEELTRARALAIASPAYGITAPETPALDGPAPLFATGPAGGLQSASVANER